jgi:hypothetical protein
VAARDEVQSDARSVDAKTDFAWEPPPSVLQRRTEPHGSAGCGLEMRSVHEMPKSIACVLAGEPWPNTRRST